MRVLIDARPLLDEHPTGVSRYARQLCDALFALPTEHEFYVFYSCSNNVVAERMPLWNHPHVHTVRSKIPSKFLHTSVTLLKRPTLDWLAKQYIGKPIDCVLSLNAQFTAVSSGVPHVLTVHDVSIAIDPKLYSWKQRLWHAAIRLKRQIQHATHIIAVSKNTKQDVESLYGRDPGQVSVAYPGAPSDRLPLRPASPAPMILFLGTCEKRKNISGVIHAFAQVRKTFSNATLALAGKPGHGWKAAEQLIAGYDLEDAVTITGYCNETIKQDLLRTADVMVYPSLYEGFGIPVIEAMTAGTPVVTSLGSSLAEAGGNAALLVHPWRHDMLADALIQLLTNQSLRETLHQNTQSHLDQFSWEHSARAVLDVINQYAHRN